MTNNTTTITVDSKTRDELQKAYDAAVASGSDTFMFKGGEVVVGYAKYLLEYMNNQLSFRPTTIAQTAAIKKK